MAEYLVDAEAVLTYITDTQIEIDKSELTANEKALLFRFGRKITEFIEQQKFEDTTVYCFECVFSRDLHEIDLGRMCMKFEHRVDAFGNCAWGERQDAKAD